MIPIKELIKTESEIEDKILNDDDFIKGVLWGKPRNGHPEGKVIYHILDVLNNIDKYSDEINRNKLRLIALLHDTFKYLVDNTKAKSGDNHHGMIARKFAEKYINDEEILLIIETHDDAYNSWSKGSRKGDWKGAEYRAKQLIERLGSSIELYLIFYSCDNQTGNKEGDDLIWFKEVYQSMSYQNI